MGRFGPAALTSLRTRLLAGLIASFTVVGALAAVVAYGLDRSEVSLSLDGQLRQIALNVGDTDLPRNARVADGVPIDPEDEFVVTIWDRTGQPHSSDSRVSLTRPRIAGYADLRIGAEDWRAYALVGADRTIEVAQRTVVRDEFATSSAVRALLPVLILIPLSWLLVGWMVNRALAPLQRVTGELQGWGKTRTAPLSLDRVPAEIYPLVAATNELVTRLQRQLEFRERFISDAAHELRTPLTALNLQARNLADATTEAERAGLTRELAAGITRMSNVVRKLLELARADAALGPHALAAVDLGAAIARSMESVIHLAAEKDVDLEVEGDIARSVLAAEDELPTLITNLLDNAVRHSPHGGRVELEVSRSQALVWLEVRDEGPGIPPDALERVFGRFVRVGPSSEGSGLGLPIVKAIADKCGASVVLSNRTDRSGLRARVLFAVAPTSASPADPQRPN